MQKEKFFKAYFITIGVYDVLLGLGFALFYQQIFAGLNIVLPNHPGYVIVPALFLASGGVGEFLIARDLYHSADLALVRLLMKASFAGAIFYCHFRYGIPMIFLVISILSVLGVIKNSMYIHWVKSLNNK